MFHLVTHAFFKALLFLGAGSVMHAMGGVIDIRRFGGLRRRLPVTHWTFLVGCLAMAGVCPVRRLLEQGRHPAGRAEQRPATAATASIYRDRCLATALLGVLLIDFYMFRPFFLTFYGPERIPPEAGHHAHESPRHDDRAAGGAGVRGAGRGGVFRVDARFRRVSWPHTPSLAYLARAQPSRRRDRRPSTCDIGVVSTVVALVGIALAAMLYLGSREKAAAAGPADERLRACTASRTASSSSIRSTTLLVVWPLLGVARLAAWFDRCVIDGLVDLCGRLPKLLGARVAAGAERPGPVLRPGDGAGAVGVDWERC